MKRLCNKRIVAVSVVVLFIVTIISNSFSAGITTYKALVEKREINNFVKNTCDIIHEYDENKDFSVNDGGDDFQSCRLIVKANGDFDTFGAKEHIKGFKNINVLQYNNISETKSAYNMLGNEKNVVSLSIDKIVGPVQGEEDEDDISTTVFPESSNGHLCDWATERTQTAQVNEYIKQNNVPLTDITVGIIDTGVDYNHEFLQGRIKRTYFNSSSGGNDNDELDMVDGHGTATSSVVIDNSPESVYVASYRVLDDEGENSISGICAGILQAINDNVDVLSVSLGFADENDLTKATVEYAKENDIPFVCSSGNQGTILGLTLLAPAIYNSTISVCASDRNNRVCSWANIGPELDLTAPGETINVAVPNNRYAVWDGTSFACPMVSAAIALVKSIHNDYSYNKIESLIKGTAIKTEEYYEEYKDKCDIDTLYGSGLLQLGSALGFNTAPKPTVNYVSGNYIDDILVEIKSKYPVYYTLDGSYPTTSSSLYCEPIFIDKDTTLRAIAYDSSSLIPYSRDIEYDYQIFDFGNDDMFDIDPNGLILSYNGNVENLIIPDEIKGVEVTDISPQVFNDGVLEKLVLPNTIDNVSQSLFSGNETLKYLNTGGAKSIQRSAFLNCKSLNIIDMPYAEEIEREAFTRSHGLNYHGFMINAPKLKYIQKNAFYMCDYVSINAPNTEHLYSNSFCMTGIIVADFPNVVSIEKVDAITRAPFYECSKLIMINMPNLERNAAASLINNCANLFVLNTLKYTGKIASTSTYEHLTSYSISKETAELSNLEYIEPSAECEHKYCLNSTTNNHAFYECKFCKNIDIYSFDELSEIWNVKYINKAPNEQSFMLNVVPDNIINGKDFAKIHHTAKYGW